MLQSVEELCSDVAPAFMERLRLHRYARRVLSYLGSQSVPVALALIWSAAKTSPAESDLQAWPSGFQRWEFTLDVDQREAFVYVPATAKDKPAPIIFVFHGHGGTAR